MRGGQVDRYQHHQHRANEAMSPKAAPLVDKSEDGPTFTLTLGAWSDSYAIDELPRWLKFYRQMRDRKNGAYAQHYAPTVRALEEFARRIER